MASNQMGDCCVRGVKHEGETVGSMTTLGAVPTYTSYPPDKSTTHAVLILPDVFSHSTNAKLLADGFAQNGYFCVIPDLFDGVPFEPGKKEIMEWFAGPPSQGPERVDGVVAAVIQELRGKYGVQKLGTVGYCFGGKYVVRFGGARGKELSASADAGFTAHPSFVDAEELQALSTPLAIAAAETDEIFTAAKRHQSEEILKGLAAGPGKIPYQINLYSAAHHGFAVRGDLSDRRIKFAKEAAFNQAVEWFNYFLKG